MKVELASIRPISFASNKRSKVAQKTQIIQN